MSDEPVSVAVIGTGNMGVNHVRVYDELPGVEIVAVVEPDAGRATEVAAAYDLSAHSSLADLPEVDAASITVPNESHRPIAEQCAERGIDLLVEKPIALTAEDGRAIVDAAAHHGVLLQVGHIEQFNPAVSSLRTILETEDLIALEAHRLGPFNEHLTTESVVFDLMIHDLDIIDSLVEGGISYLDAVGTVTRSAEVDHATAHFKFDDGELGTVTASHVTHGKVRALDVTTSDAFVRLDYQMQDVKIQRRGLEQTTRLEAQSGYRTETVTETPFVGTREPLKVELEHFVECVRERRTPQVSGEDGVRAVELATTVVDQITDT